ncbi:MAG: 2-C-methyl-D-erythritol 4-phosphate cytidylyltransferase [Firmicutes bacterium]|nr:2-C-methyl-D-erythritol 4-phosphate cytidylyltransferase [Bacillota bacterium]
MLTAIVVAAGQSRRMGVAGDKILAKLAGHPLVAHSLAVLSSLPEVSDIVLVGNSAQIDTLNVLVEEYDFSKVRAVVPGGEERRESVSLGLEAIDWPVEYVAVHDAARPCLAKAEAREVIADGVAYGAATLAIPVVDTIKQVEYGAVVATLDRSSLWAIQTPQVFKYDWLVKGHANWRQVREPITDDAVLVSALGHKVRVTPGSRANVKVTTPEDLLLATFYLEQGGRLCL